MLGQPVPGNVAPNNTIGLQQQQPTTNQMLPQVSTSDPLPINTQIVSKATDVQPPQQPGTMFVSNPISQGEFIVSLLFVILEFLRVSPHVWS